jgi:hypothetical protein
MRVLLLGLLLLCQPVQAADYTLLSGFVSKHSNPGYCENNLGLGIRANTGSLQGFAIGGYKNSLCKTSFYISKEYLWQVSGPWHAGAAFALVTGYQLAITPVPIPQVVFRHSGFEIAFLGQPARVGTNPAFIAIQLRKDI